MSSAGFSRLWALPDKRYQLIVTDKKTGKFRTIDFDSPKVADEYIELARMSGKDVDVFDHGPNKGEGVSRTI